MKKIMIDMSVFDSSWAHKINKKARKYGDLIIALSTDKNTKKYKGYTPELKFKFRKEILL